jgi:hypothetical protein
MSVAIAVKVSEGLVLGADSAATIRGKIQRPEGIQEGVLKTYFNARKLMQIGDFPIGVLTWGAAFIGSRTIESLVREWEYDNHWQTKQDYDENYEDDFQVKKCAQELSKHIAKTYLDEFGDEPDEEKPIIGFIVAGYSQRGFFPEIWRFIVPLDEEGAVHNQRPDRNGKPDFGATWYGLTDAIVRLHFGRDDQVIKIMSEKTEMSQQEVAEILQPLQYQILFPVMPLQDAIEYAYYMLNVTVGRYRFVVGPELCGGEIEIAAITQKEFKWISRKTWSLGE